MRVSMSRFDPYLKTYVESKDGKGLRTEIADVWQSIRGTNLYSGGPRSAQTDQAIAQSLAALKVASQTNDRALLAEACRLMAHTLNADEQYEQSVDYYQKAIALFESSGCGEQASRTRLGFIAALYMMGKYDEAMEVAGTAERWFKANNQPLGLAKVYTNIGNLNYRREQPQVALQYHSKARALFEQLKDWPAIAMSYLNVANGLAFTDLPAEAEKMYNVAEEIGARLNMQELFIQVRYNKSYLMFLQGRYVESLEAFKAVRDYFARTGSRHHVNLCDLDVAEIYLHLLKPAEAVTYAERAIQGFSKTAMRYEHAKAIAFSAMGLAQLDRLDEAAGVVAAVAHHHAFGDRIGAVSRGDHRGAAFGRADIFGKPGIETAPIVHPSDEALEELARILDGPGLDALNRIGVMARPLLARPRQAHRCP